MAEAAEFRTYREETEMERRAEASSRVEEQRRAEAEMQRRAEAESRAEEQRRRELQQQQLHAARTQATQQRGYALINAFRTGGDVDELFARASTEPVDYSVKDECGMTVLHHAARELHLNAVLHIVRWYPHLANEVTYVNRHPAGWTPLICAADKPRPKDPGDRQKHAALCKALADVMHPARLLHWTKYGTTALHTMVSRVHGETLRVVLPVVCQKVGHRDLARHLNSLAGRSRRGALDHGLATNRVLLERLLRQYGATEQRDAPSNWRPNRRYHEGNGYPDNARSDSRRRR